MVVATQWLSIFASVANLAFAAQEGLVLLQLYASGDQRDEESNTPTCRGFCARLTNDWASKCNWDHCHECSDCTGLTAAPTTESVCQNWCSLHTRDWSTKCNWGTCNGCPECNGTPAPTPSPTTPVVETPAPTPSPTMPVVETPAPTPSPTMPVVDTPAPTPSPTVVGAEGLMSMWTAAVRPNSGSSCGFKQDGTTADVSGSVYMSGTPLRVCAVSEPLYAGGAACGSCYRVSKAEGAGPVNTPAGSEIVQVVDRMANEDRTFDCQLESFELITHHNTDVFPITYEQVPCETNSGPIMEVVGGLATIQSKYTNTCDRLSGGWRVIFFNLQRGVTSVTMTIGNEGANAPSGPLALTRHGAGWDVPDMAPYQGAVKPIVFLAVLDDGTTVTVDTDDYAEFNGVFDPRAHTTLQPPAPDDCVDDWQQCGDGGVCYVGPTCCKSADYTCKGSGSWYACTP